MDKNTIIGLVLILGIVLGFSWFNKPSQEQIEVRKRYNDSIAFVQIEEQRLAELQQQQTNSTTAQMLDNDSVISTKFGLFASVTKGDTNLVEIETELLKLQFSPQGGFIYSAELKKYRTHDLLPLMLFTGKEENELNFTFQTLDNRVFTTENLFFVPQKIIENSLGKLLTMRLSVSDSAYLDFVYTIKNDSYMIDFDIVAHNMSNYFYPMTSSLEFVWNSKIRQQEKGRKFEGNYSTLNYFYANNGGMEKISPTKNSEKTEGTPLQWIAAKDQFFSTAILAKQHFPSAKFLSVMMPDNSPYIKSYSVNSSIFFDPAGKQATNLQVYLGPNHYKMLASFDKGLPSNEKPHLQRLIPLGWTLFRWISQVLIIPMFNFFGSFMTNFGLIILLMTIVIKVIILPFTFKSYMSTAKMKVLKPQIDAINARIPADKMMERQQATMKLYKDVGVSPMGGCLPMLFQMPVLFAMFAFFPSAIELRQQSFLWATDLSTYDTIPFLTWNFDVPFIGRHLSLFCLLMTITNVVYTKLNMATTAGAQQQMAIMKWMMYLMPVMFLFIFNDYAAGLSYYYLVSLLITIGQTYLFRLFVDEKKLLKKLEFAKANKKPAKKSGFMARLEAAQKEQQKRLREQHKKSRK